MSEAFGFTQVVVDLRLMKNISLPSEETALAVNPLCLIPPPLLENAFSCFFFFGFEMPHAVMVLTDEMTDDILYFGRVDEGWVLHN